MFWRHEQIHRSRDTNNVGLLRELLNFSARTVLQTDLEASCYKRTAPQLHVSMDCGWVKIRTRGGVYLWRGSQEPLVASGTSYIEQTESSTLPLLTFRWLHVLEVVSPFQLHIS